MHGQDYGADCAAVNGGCDVIADFHDVVLLVGGRRLVAPVLVL
jgi:hypothetical protein